MHIVDAKAIIRLQITLWIKRDNSPFYRTRGSQPLRRWRSAASFGERPRSGPRCRSIAPARMRLEIRSGRADKNERRLAAPLVSTAIRLRSGDFAGDRDLDRDFDVGVQVDQHV